ncbi:Mov34/MPN/PAD-1 family protein [Paenibacillus hunanensis]|uniref:Mov34/MPN/PAD-1 family protein n=1 Tax=Paenibacillus hunanensis TaxID=539262 RepID=UPI002A69A470|nr:Mov34/MPN/PAD-1 family protein [Paenibacillus hunanensis]WPP40018.1 Mov34/MPN/PAD-1 family protein [Paenibacillus hunanensis]
MKHHPHHSDKTDPASLYISQSVWHELIDHMNSAPAHEVCGVLLGTKTAVGIQLHAYRRLRNVSLNPAYHFQLDPAEWIHCCYNEPNLVGLFHSHPHTAPLPSQEDLGRLPDFASMISVYLIGTLSIASSEPEQDHQQTYTKPSSSNQTPYAPTDPLDHHPEPIRAYNIIQHSPEHIATNPTHSSLQYDLIPVQLLQK